VLSIPAYFLVFIDLFCWPAFLPFTLVRFSLSTLETTDSPVFRSHTLLVLETICPTDLLIANRYLRLMILALTDTSAHSPSASSSSTSTPPRPQLSSRGSNTHFRPIPTSSGARTSVRVLIEFTRWMFPACAALFWALFGLAEEARRNYVMWAAAGWLVGYKPKPKAGQVTPWSVPSFFSFFVSDA
jgi:pheromone a factor receptor